MAYMRMVNKKVPGQRNGTHQAALDARGRTQQADPERLRWPWLLSDRGISAAVLTVTGLGITALVSMWLIASNAGGTERAKLQIEALKYGLGFVAAAGAIAALLLAVRRQRLSEHAHHLELRKQDHAEQNTERSRELELRRQEHSEADSAERRVTELYTKAVEQLGHTDAAVRLGGLYALERVAQNNPEQRQTIVNVLCAYLRMPYTPPADSETTSAISSGRSAEVSSPAAQSRDPRQELQVRLTAQRILTGHLRLPGNRSLEQMSRLTTEPGLTFWPNIDLDLTGAQIVELDLTQCRVRDLEASGAVFSGQTLFGMASISGNASFGGATFSGPAWFGEATFSGPAWFGKTTFSKNAGFEGTRFSMNAVFEEATFSGPAWFEKAAFSGGVRCRKATFSEDVGFAGATFSRNAMFGEVTFSEAADFERAKFAKEADFGGATFAQSAGFGEVAFSESAVFEDVTFSGEAWYEKATFYGDVWFGGAKFNSDPDFTDSRVWSKDESFRTWPPGWAYSGHQAGEKFGTLVRESPSRTLVRESPSSQQKPAIRQ